MTSKGQKVKDILLYVIEHNTTILESEKHHNTYDGFVRKYIRRSPIEVKSSVEYKEIFNLYKRFKNRRNLSGKDMDNRLNDVVNHNTPRENVSKNRVKEFDEDVIKNIETQIENETEYDPTSDEKYEETRSRYWEERDKENRIIQYCYEIQVRDEKPFKGFISRSDMEKIFSLYPYCTQNQLSLEFSYTLKEMGRILRVFRITKDKKFPQHVLEEYSEEEIVKFALKAKERSAYKNFETQLNQFYKIKYNELVKKHSEQERKNEFYEGVIDKLSVKKVEVLKVNKPINYSEEGNYVKSLFSIFSDIHFGKKNRLCKPKYGRGNNKEILKERCLRIAEETVSEFHSDDYDKINFICLGDLFESILSDGMHHAHLEEMDIKGADQIEYAFDVLVDMVNIILEGTNGLLKRLDFHLIGGNHDRIGKNRDEDTDRTATKILFKFLEKIYKDESIIKIHTYENGIISFEDDDISFIGHHGDKQLNKRKPEEIMNLFKLGNNENFTLIANGHFHSMVQNEGLNYMELQVGSVCSSDDYSHDNLGYGNQPSFVLGGKAKEGYGFDFRKITLY